MNHGGKLVCQAPGEGITVAIQDTDAGEAADEVSKVLLAPWVAPPRPGLAEQAGMGDIQVSQC